MYKFSLICHITWFKSMKKVTQKVTQGESNSVLCIVVTLLYGTVHLKCLLYGHLKPNRLLYELVHSNFLIIKSIIQMIQTVCCLEKTHDDARHFANLCICVHVYKNDSYKVWYMFVQLDVFHFNTRNCIFI